MPLNKVCLKVMSKTPLLSYESVSASYGPVQALKDISLHIHEGEIVTLIGANGAGKTTLLMSLFGQPPISDGIIKYQNQTINFCSPALLIKRGISVSPEGRRIFPKLSVMENLELGAYTLRDAVTMKRQQKLVFELFPILHKRQTQRAGTLSGGEQQMLAIGRALMSSPKLFLLDEPSLGLAPQLVIQIFKVLKEIANQGTTIFLVEQNANHALKLAHRGYVLVNGSLTLSGTGEELLNNPEIQAAYLGKHSA